MPSVHSTAVEPLVPLWCDRELAPQRAGATTTARVVLRNGGGATWRSRGDLGLQLSYHWLDRTGNAIFWDGTRAAFPHPVPPGDTVALEIDVVAPRPPGRYVLSFDLIEEHHFWLSELGLATLDVEVEVAPLIAERRLAVVVHGGPDPRTSAALAAQAEPPVREGPVATAHLVSGAEPAPDWSSLVLDAHEEGWAAVGPALVPQGRPLERRLARRRLERWAPAGRNPRFGAPLLLPSLVGELEPDSVEGLPAYTGGGGLFEGRAIVRLPRRSGRPLR